MILASLLLTCWILLCLMFWTQVRRLTVKKKKKTISSRTEGKRKTNVFLNQTYLRGCSVYPCSRKESPQI